MSWTLEQLVAVPKVYYSFLVALRPVITARDTDSVIKPKAVHFNTIYGLIANQYDYSVPDLRVIARNLEAERIITIDKYGQCAPTAKGEKLLKALDELWDYDDSQVPALPHL